MAPKQLTPAARMRRRAQGARRWRNFWLLILLLGIGALVAFTLFFWSVAASLPAPNQVVRDSGFSTKIYDRHGELLYDFYADAWREPFTLDQVSPHLINATVAVEDKDFYKHSGFDFLTIVRIPYYYLTQHRVVGGSTLTQQLTKMMLLTNERKIMRKFRELILSMQIEKMFTKDQILEMYLNESPYGGNIHGANLAAQQYFHTNVSDLSVAQAAVIAGLPQAPGRYSPFAGYTNDEGEYYWHIRASGVLRRMLEDGYISQSAYQDALAELDTFEFTRQISDIKAPHFVFYVEDLLRDMYGDEMVDAGGLEVYTTLDYQLQASAEAIVASEIDKVADSYGISNGAALVLDPQTGQILSMVGSRDYFSSDIDGQFNVTAHPQALRQPGSSIKPLVYLAFLQQGGTAAHMFADVPTTFQANELITPYTPKNYDGKFRGPVSLRNSLGNSFNIPAVKALSYVGMQNFLSFAEKAGISTLAPTPENLQNLGVALALGGGEIHMIELAGAYCAFANGGYKVEPTAILQVKTVQGDVLFQQNDVRGAQVFGEDETFIINDILSDNSARMLEFGANSLLNTGRPIAVKTGTTNQMKDNWTIGWSQSFLVHVWVGNNDATPMKSVASGITGASPIWRAIVNRLVELGYPTPEFVQPKNVIKAQVDDLSGYPEHDGFPAHEEYFVKNTLPTGNDPIHTKLKLCRGEANKLATDSQINVGDYDEREYIVMRENDPISQDGVNRWQMGIDAWAADQGDERYHAPTETCGVNSDLSVAFYGISNGENTELDHIKFGVRASSETGVEKIELYRNGERISEEHAAHFETEWQLNRGIYELKAVVTSRDGKQAETVIKVGVGGDKV
ncbi:transglycosylase domain-containing protein [bacterium]|nr:transglycosylase domain-containing protein [bacterium]